MLVTGVSIGDVGRRPCGLKVPSELSCPLSPIGAEEVQAGGSLGVVRIQALHLLTHGPILFSIQQDDGISIRGGGAEQLRQRRST
jgi:hypothetical protein